MMNEFSKESLARADSLNICAKTEICIMADKYNDVGATMAIICLSLPRNDVAMFL